MNTVYQLLTLSFFAAAGLLGIWSLVRDLAALTSCVRRSAGDE